MGSLSTLSIAFPNQSVDHSLFTRLISLSSRLILLLSKIELLFSTIMVSNTTYAVAAGRDSAMGSLWSYRGDHNLNEV